MRINISTNLNSKTILGIFLFLSFFILTSTTYAQPFAPGTELNPSCLPTSATCIVDTIYYGNEVTGGTANEILYINSTGDLDSDSAFNITSSSFEAERTVTAGYTSRLALESFVVTGLGGMTFPGAVMEHRNTGGDQAYSAVVTIGSAPGYSSGYVAADGATRGTFSIDASGFSSNHVTASSSFSLALNSSGFTFNNVTSGDSYTFPTDNGTNGQVLQTNGSGTLTWANGSSLSGLTAATATNTINNANYAQEWQWNTLTSNTGLSLTSSSTLASTSTQKLLAVSMSGLNVNPGETTYAASFVNTHTGTSSTNVAGYFSASGGTNNYALVVPAGYVGIGTETPSGQFNIVSGDNSFLYNISSTSYSAWPTFGGGLTISDTSQGLVGNAGLFQINVENANANIVGPMIDLNAGTSTNNSSLKIFTAHDSVSLSGITAGRSYIVADKRTGGGAGSMQFHIQNSGTATASHIFSAGNSGATPLSGTATPSITMNYYGLGTFPYSEIMLNGASANATLSILGSGSTSSTYGLKVNNSTGTNNALVVRDDGFVGLGTTPSYNLHVSGSGTAFYFNPSATYPNFSSLNFANSNTGLTSFTNFSISSASDNAIIPVNMFLASGSTTNARTGFIAQSHASFSGGGSAGTFPASSLILASTGSQSSTTTKTIIWTQMNGGGSSQIWFGGNNSSGLSATTAGRAMTLAITGLGVTPVAKLGINMWGTDPTATLQVQGSGTSSSTYGLQVHDSSGSNNALVVRDDGSVGILTSSPSAKLHILGDGVTSTEVFRAGQSGSGSSNYLRMISNLTTNGPINIDTYAANNSVGLVLFSNILGSSYDTVLSTASRGVFSVQVSGNSSATTVITNRPLFTVQNASMIHYSLFSGGGVGAIPVSSYGASSSLSLPSTNSVFEQQVTSYNSAGSLFLHLRNTRDSDVSNTLAIPSYIKFTGAYWDGSNNVAESSIRQNITTSGQRLSFYGGASESVSITSDGSLGIGDTTPDYRLHVSDTSTAGIVGAFTNSDGTCTLDPGDVSGWSCPSDINLKKDITTLDSALANIMQLNPVTYRLINESQNEELSIGLIAQEVQSIFPKLVKQQLDGTLALNYGGLTPLVIKSIQELNIKITDLQSLDLEKPFSAATLIKTFLEDVNNMIDTIFARKVDTQEIQTDRLCVGSTCVTEQQLIELLNNNSIEQDNNPPESIESEITEENESENTTNEEAPEEGIEIQDEVVIEEENIPEEIIEEGSEETVPQEDIQPSPEQNIDQSTTNQE